MRTVVAIVLILIPVTATICRCYYMIKARRTYRRVIDELLD